jgi:hypothetical protein
MQSELPMHLSPRCGARARGRNPCRSPGMANAAAGCTAGSPRGTEGKQECSEARAVYGGLYCLPAINRIVDPNRAAIRNMLAIDVCSSEKQTQRRHQILGRC